MIILSFQIKLKLQKKKRKFVLKTDSLIGSFKIGNYYTDDNVDIISSNIRIKGTGLDVKKNGEYIKVKGKATLKMLLSNKK